MPTVVQIVASGVPILFFQRGTAYWMLLDNVGSGFPEMYSSTNLTNWTQIGGEGPSAGVWPVQPMVAVWDGADTVTMFYQEGTLSGTTALVQFNLVSGTWGSAFGQQVGGVAGNGLPDFMAINSTGGFVVVYGDATSVDGPFQTQTWDGASWSAIVNICATVQALPGYIAAQNLFLGPACALDSSDVLHCIFNLFSFNPTFNHQTYYQEITSGGLLQNFQTFAGQSGASPDLVNMNLQTAPQLLISAGVLYWGIQRNNYAVGPNPFAAIYVGSPLINPTWVETGNIDTSATSTQSPLLAPVLQQIGSTLFASFIRPNPTATGSQVETVTTTNGFASSTPQILTDTSAGGPPVHEYGPFLLQGPHGLLMATGGGGLEGPETAASFTSLGPLTQSIKITFRGVKRIRCKPQDDLAEMPPPLPSVDRAV